MTIRVTEMLSTFQVNFCPHKLSTLGASLCIWSPFQTPAPQGRLQAHPQDAPRVGLPHRRRRHLLPPGGTPAVWIGEIKLISDMNQTTVCLR